MVAFTDFTRQQNKANKMVKREELLEQGIGAVEAVCDHFEHQPQTDAAVSAAIAEIAVRLPFLMSREATRPMALAIVASCMNAEFNQSGRLWKVKADGAFGYTYITDQLARDVVSAAM